MFVQATQLLDNFPISYHGIMTALNNLCFNLKMNIVQPGTGVGLDWFKNWNYFSKVVCCNKEGSLISTVVFFKYE